MFNVEGFISVYVFLTNNTPHLMAPPIYGELAMPNTYNLHLSEDDSVAVRNLPTLVTISDLEQLVGFRRTTIYRYIRNPEIQFPKPIKFGVASRWSLAEVQLWLDGRMAARDQSEVA